MMLMYRTIKEYPHFTLVGVYQDVKYLYPTAINKLLPTEMDNLKIIQGFKKPIVITAEEKELKQHGRKPLTEEKIRVIKIDMQNKSYTAQEVKKRHNISDKTFKKIKGTVLENFVIDRRDYGFDEVTT